MSQSKLKSIHIIIIGSVACIIAVAGLYFALIKGATERISGLDSQLQAAEAKAATRGSVEAQLVSAQQQYRILQAKYDKYMKEKMPSIPVSDRFRAMEDLWKEQIHVLGPMIEKWPARKGVRLTSSFSIPEPPVNPNSISDSMITLPLGTFTVVGDFVSIMNHIKSWNDFGRLVKIDLTSLSGQSPNLTASYSVTVYIFPQGTLGPAIPMAGGAAATEQAPGAAPGLPQPPMP